KEYKKATGKSKLLYAQVLGMCGEKTGVPALKLELNKFKSWDEKIFQGSMADYAHLPTPIDAVILALGYSNDKSVLPDLLKLVDKLDANVTLSHHRSLALALENFSSPTAAQHIANLLQKPDMQGHTIFNLEDALSGMYNDGKGTKPIKNSSLDKRTKSFREIILARTLFECGDYNDIGINILRNYTQDMRGLFDHHANSILQKQVLKQNE
ncbi:MAG: hypothetical protein L3J54_14055, partial [Draconibacterium sp.]|nr:hypothetical protein [Draconibacterium sp.]